MKEINEECIIRFLNGKLGESETIRLQEWIELSEENTTYFESIRDIWLSTSVFVDSNNYDHEKALKLVRWKINQKSHVKHHRRSSKKSKTINLQQVFRYAAAILLVLAMGTVAGWITRGKISQNGETACMIESPSGSMSVVTLPDGSRVWINAESSLKYDANFNLKSREVLLDGEAYFDVSTNKEKPFIVKTPHITVSAFGTEFNVKAYSDEKTIVTTLVEGNVVVESTDNESGSFKYTLKPKENITYFINDRSYITEKQEPKKEEKAAEPVKMVEPERNITLNKGVKTELYTSWKDEDWVIEGVTLDELAIQLERRYNTSITINTESLKSYRFSGKIRNETLEQVLEILRLTTPMKYEIETGKVTWELDPKLEKDYQKLLKKQ